MPQLTEDRSIGDLFGQLTQDMGLLVKQEVRLAKAEMSEKASRVAKGGASTATGAMVAYVGALAIAAAVILGLVAAGVSPWLAALIVGIGLAVSGWLMLQKGLKLFKDTSLVPRRTVESLKDDVQLAKELKP